MLSRNTYAVWNTFVGILCVLMALATMHFYFAYAIGFAVLALVFWVFAVLAYKGIGMYYKHPVNWKPNGEPEVKNG